MLSIRGLIDTLSVNKSKTEFSVFYPFTAGIADAIVSCKWMKKYQYKIHLFQFIIIGAIFTSASEPLIYFRYPMTM